MRLPFLQNIQQSVKPVGVFKGLNQKLVVSDGEFADMKNMSDRYYPVIATREPRGPLIKTLTKPNGLFYKNGLFYIDGTECYYKGEDTGVRVTDGDKLLVSMGAYIVIMPDMTLFNTSDGTYKPLEAKYIPSDTVTFAPLSTNSAYTKITAGGIGACFSKYDNVTISGCYDNQFNVTKVITDSDTDYIVVTGVISSSFTMGANSGLAFTRKVPEMDFVCELDNRLWGCSSKNHEVYASKLGDPTNWSNYEGIATDSYALTIGSDGDFTGCIAYQGYMLFFKENTIHMIYGNKPSTYTLNTKQLPGVRKGCEGSLQIVNEMLYYVGRNGVYAYNGEAPSLISENITGKITDAVASQENGKYYLSCKFDGVQTLLVYDPSKGIWDKEDGTEFVYASYGEGQLYYVGSDKKVMTVTGDSTEVFDWYIESGDCTESSMEEKYVSKLMFNLWMTEGSEADIQIKYDDEPEWKSKGTVHCTQNTTYTLPIIPNRCNKYRWRIKGKGQMKLLGYQRTVESGTKLNGNIHSFRKR